MEGEAMIKNGPPLNAFRMAIQGFRNNMNGIRGIYNNERERDELTKDQELLHSKLKCLKLNVAGIWERERGMEEMEAPLLIQIPYYFLCFLLDVVFEGRYIPARFYFLETVA